MKKIELNGNYIIELTKPEGEVKFWHISFQKKDKDGVSPVFDAPITLTRGNDAIGSMEFELDSKNLFIESIPNTVGDTE